MSFKKVFSPAAALLLAATVAATALAADVAGTWTWTTKSKKGKETQSTLTLSAQGEKLTGDLLRGKKSREISNGTIKGDEISFEVKTERNGQEIVQKFEGKVEGDTITGTTSGGRPGGGGKSRDWEAKRSK
jgi:hypothetical protein